MMTTSRDFPVRYTARMNSQLVELFLKCNSLIAIELGERFGFRTDKAKRILQLLDSPSPSPPLTEMQEMILVALDGRVMTGEQLRNDLCGSKETLYGKSGKGGLTELCKEELVINDRRVGGYYRPDKPPQNNLAYKRRNLL